MEPAAELAVFRRLQGDGSFFVSIAKRLLPGDAPRLTVTLANPEAWPRHLHVVKERGRASIHGSLKLVVSRREAVVLGLRRGCLVWVRVLPFTETPPPVPARPYIARPARVQGSGSSLYIVVSARQVEALRRVCPGDLLLIRVRRGDKAVEYTRRPAHLRERGLYKIRLPAELFRGLVRPGDTVYVTIEPVPGPAEEKKDLRTTL